MLQRLPIKAIEEAPKNDYLLVVHRREGFISFQGPHPLKMRQGRKKKRQRKEKRVAESALPRSMSCSCFAFPAALLFRYAQFQ
jgi:hypothetical protein